MSEYCTECGAHENAWGKGPVMDELTNEISRLRALLKQVLDEIGWVSLVSARLRTEIDAELRGGG